MHVFKDIIAQRLSLAVRWWVTLILLLTVGHHQYCIRGSAPSAHWSRSLHQYPNSTHITPNHIADGWKLTGYTGTLSVRFMVRLKAIWYTHCNAWRDLRKLAILLFSKIRSAPTLLALSSSGCAIMVSILDQSNEQGIENEKIMLYKQATALDGWLSSSQLLWKLKLILRYIIVLLQVTKE